MVVPKYLASNQVVIIIQHDHLPFLPPANTFMSLPVEGKVTTELACTNSGTTDIQKRSDPYPGLLPTEYHTEGSDDLKGTAFAIKHEGVVSR